MEFNSEFEPLQKVWPIARIRREVFVMCSFCAGTGNIKGVDGERATCPKCHGNGGKARHKGEKWSVQPSLTVGEIRLIHIVPDPAFLPGVSRTEEEYMCIETGIGSGTIYHGEHLFASLESAKAECYKRNEEA
jgi:hypothetical protein